jgi:periplasmic protein TonB
MPRDLFGDVTRPSISIGNRKWYTVPVSLLSHAIVLAMVVIVPILAAPMMPGVVDNDTLYRFIEIVPPTLPPVPKPRTQELKPVEPAGPPTQAPDGFAPEKPSVPSGWEDDKPVGTFIPDTDPDVITPPPPVLKKDPPPAPVRVGGTVRTPIKTYDVSPVYPAIAQAARIQGIVIIEATLSEEGRVVNARLLRSVPLLDQAALEAVRQWVFTPTLLNGVPVPVIMTVTVNFTLNK